MSPGMWAPSQPATCTHSFQEGLQGSSYCVPEALRFSSNDLQTLWRLWLAHNRVLRKRELLLLCVPIVQAKMIPRVPLVDWSLGPSHLIPGALVTPHPKLAWGICDKQSVLTCWKELWLLLLLLGGGGVCVGWGSVQMWNCNWHPLLGLWPWPSCSGDPFLRGRGSGLAYLKL